MNKYLILFVLMLASYRAIVNQNTHMLSLIHFSLPDIHMENPGLILLVSIHHLKMNLII